MSWIGGSLLGEPPLSADLVGQMLEAVDASADARLPGALELLHAWDWLQNTALRGRVPVIDHMWQTETSGPVFGNAYGLGMLPIKPGSAAIPLPGIEAAVVSPDGRTLAWRGMKRPGFEADRFGIMVRDLATGATREIAPHWDRSAQSLLFSPDGRTLYTTADDVGSLRVFAIDIASGAVRRLTGDDSGWVCELPAVRNRCQPCNRTRKQIQRLLFH